MIMTMARTRPQRATAIYIAQAQTVPLPPFPSAPIELTTSPAATRMQPAIIQCPPMPILAISEPGASAEAAANRA